jgi:hypothetical protein
MAGRGLEYLQMDVALVCSDDIGFTQKFCHISKSTLNMHKEVTLCGDCEAVVSKAKGNVSNSERLSII